MVEGPAREVLRNGSAATDLPAVEALDRAEHYGLRPGHVPGAVARVLWDVGAAVFHTFLDTRDDCLRWA
ncbi:hypothetical protein OG252_04950 [Streptomyces sp. NBC_01352]|uniref:hypothetical protein n=1 Tax=unclassified Streptomyces TaxID=2593676 RepID=UPI002255BE3B|nr:MULTISPECIES: hypothetical protein [unclassified Streptomyces]MCX4706105.1 hypothetical protein [Streptomyces sp. NBC_01373]